MFVDIDNYRSIVRSYGREAGNEAVVEAATRLKKIVLTEKAIENHKKIIANIQKREERLKKGISDNDLKVFFNVMNRLTANMEEQND